MSEPDHGQVMLGDLLTGERLLTAKQAAEVFGVRLKTWHRSVYRGSYPPPDVRVGRTPLWKESTVRGHRQADGREQT